MWLQNPKNHEFWECSRCHHEAYWDTDYGQQLFDFCPYCGKSCRETQKAIRYDNYRMAEFEGEMK